MFLYATAVGLFFAFFSKETKPERIRLFAVIFSALFLGAIALGWLMYPFPLK